MAALGLLGYIAALLTLSGLSVERHLSLGEEKSIGFFDPHLHVAVIGVERLDSWRGAPGLADPAGALLLVTVRARCNSARIVVDPSALDVLLVDARGRELPPLEVPPVGERAPVTRIAGPLGPGESYTRQLLFRLPPDAREPALWVVERSWITRLFPGTEYSFLHRKVLFELG